MGLIDRLASAAGTVVRVADDLSGKRISAARDKVEDTVKDALPDALGPRGILHIENPILAQVATDLDKYDGNNNSVVEKEETQAKAQRLEGSIKGLEAERDGYAYG